MSAVMLPARFDGERIVLDEPYELRPDTRLVVTVLPPEADEEREDWLHQAQLNLEAAYGPDEPEYTLADIKQWNPNYREGNIVLSPVAQADGRTKNRPALVLREFSPYGDVLICGFSTQLHQRVTGFDELLLPSDPDFAASGLRAASLIRLGFLSVVTQDSIAGAIGTVSEERHQRLLRRLSLYLVERL